jgi:hypothetical protein
MPVDLDEFALAKLAREMAMAIRPYTAVFEDFGITEEDYYEIQKLDFFKRAKEQFALEWNSALSVYDRTKLKAATSVEEAMQKLAKRALRDDEPLTSVTDTIKLFARIAGMGEPKTDKSNTAERFVIEINLGADTETYDKSIEVNPNDIPPSKPLIEAKPIKPEKPKRGRPPKTEVVTRGLFGLFDE